MPPRDTFHRFKDLALTGLAFALVLYAVTTRPEVPAGPQVTTVAASVTR
ncbi:hypothetical protein [Phreatobacter stygius]|nr:hypothetical protein [Phreatobacter stygius]